jgi:hypothetical protein
MAIYHIPRITTFAYAAHRTLVTWSNLVLLTDLDKLRLECVTGYSFFALIRSFAVLSYIHQAEIKGSLPIELRPG